MKGKISDFMYDIFKKKTVVQLELDGQQLENIEKLKDKDLTIDFKLWRNKRSLSANRYRWVLIHKMAEIMDMSAVEIYRQHIKNIGVFQDIEVNEQAEKTITKVWSEYGLGWCTERVDMGVKANFIILRLWYGSSVYDTKQMARFIDGLVQDCKALEIETLPPEEIERLIKQSEEMRV